MCNPVHPLHSLICFGVFLFCHWWKWSMYEVRSLSCWYLIICIKGLSVLISDNSRLHLSPKLPFSVEITQFWHGSLILVLSGRVSYEQGEITASLNHLTQDKPAFSTYTQHMASSTKHNPTATTCNTIKTLEKSF